MAKRRTYNRAFKLQALELGKTRQKSINEIERDLGITPGLLHKWKARMTVDGSQAFPGKGRLKREIEVLRRDGQQRSVSNLLGRDFTADAPNHKWLVDITAIGTDEGPLYLAGVLDLFSHRLVGWAMDEHMPDELTQEALEMAIVQRRPPNERLHHADQGSQYTSDEYQALLAKHHMLASFSGVGCCYDNAPNTPGGQS